MTIALSNSFPSWLKKKKYTGLHFTDASNWSHPKKVYNLNFAFEIKYSKS